MNTDLDLLSRYVERNDRAAINELFSRHYPSVYHTILKLVSHETVARDLTQDTFVQVLRSARSFEPTGKFRSWILTIALNEVRQHWRSPRPARLPDGLEALFEEVRQERPDLAAGRRELERAVESALEQLPEKLKVPLVLHYYEQLSLAEIGDVLGMPKSAVQRRCETALERLRRHFERGGLASLVPVFLRSFPSLDPSLRKTLTRPVSALGSAAVLGVLSLKSTVAISAALLFAVLLGITVLRRSATADLAPLAARRMSSPPDLHGGPPPADAGRTAAPHEPLPEAQDRFESEGPGVVTGTVLRLPDYTPVPGARVEIAPAGNAFRNVTTTRADGRFECRRLPVGERYRLLVTHPALGYQERDGLPLTAFQTTLDAGVILMDRGLRLRGIVQTETGTPIPGALVRAGNPGSEGATNGDLAEIPAGISVQTDPDGRFDLGPISPGCHDLQILKAGFARKDLQGFWIPPSGPGADLDIRLEQGGEIAGVVVDEAGKPLAGIKVSGGVRDLFQRLTMGILSHRSFAATVTDADGRFRVSGLPSRRNQVVVIASAEGYLQSQTESAASASDLRLVLRSAKGPCSLLVRLRHHETGAALSPSGGSFILKPDCPGVEYRGAPDEPAGSVQFSGLPSGEFRLEAQAPGFKGTKTLRVDGVRTSVEVEMRPVAARFTIRGVVVDEDTRLPIPNAVIRDGFGTIPFGKADAGGAYSFITDDGDPSVYFEGFMSVAAEGYHPRVFSVKFPEEGNEVAMILPLARTSTLVEVRGRVLDPNGAAVPGCDVRLRLVPGDRDHDVGIRSQHTDLDGRFVLPKIPADALDWRCRFELRHPMFPPQTVEIPNQEALQELTFRLAPGAALSGTVVGDGDAPVRGAVVLAFRKDHSQRPLGELHYFEALGTVRCDDRGRFTFPSLPREPLLLLPSEAGHSISEDAYANNYLFTPGSAADSVTLRLKDGAYPKK